MLVVAAAAVAAAAGRVAAGRVAVGMIAVGIAVAASACRSLVAVIRPSPSRPSHRAAVVAVRQVIATNDASDPDSRTEGCFIERSGHVSVESVSALQ